MLPLHRLAADGPKSSFRIGRFARRSVRWIAVSGIFAVSIWILGSFFVHRGPRLPPVSVGWTELENAPPPQVTVHKPPPSSIWDARANQVKEAYLHAFSGYQKHAAPYDELLPISGGRVNKYVFRTHTTI